ncbi:MAG: Ni/Fe hydrogenase subunit alpha [Acidimicrobiales bacterium]
MTPSGASANHEIDVHGLARVEGEGSLHVAVRDGILERVELEIFEPPRFFEAFLRGRSFEEPPDITARICGICPVAYQMSACAAIEDACGVQVDDRIGRLRRLLYCGEWIQSHALHIYLLHAPDFFGCRDAVELAALDAAAVQRGLRLKKLGNHIMETVGGRAIHPVNVRVGGFYRAPDREEITALIEPLRRAREESLETVAWVAGFDFPEIEPDYRFVALSHPDHYAIEAGRVASSDGIDATPAEFALLAVEEHVARSSALHSRLNGRDPYLTGPLARYALNEAKLPQVARDAAAQAGLGPVCTNPFKSVIVRAVELLFACDEALRLATDYEPPEPPAAKVVPAARAGAGATEAPRGMLLQRYELDAAGTIQSARIMPPTSQNQLTIESDVRRVVESGLELSDAELTARCELAIRNHDPCISCAAHFLDVSIDRS